MQGRFSASDYGELPMNGLLLLVAAATTGVDVGWQPLAGGGYEYIIQIEPEALAAMQQGRDVVSDLPPELRNIRRYRITIGTGPVPRIGTPPEVSDPSVLEGDPQLLPRGPTLPTPPNANDTMVRDNRLDSNSGLRVADRPGGTLTNDRYGSPGADPYGTSGSALNDPRLGAATGIGAPTDSRFPASDPYGTTRFGSGESTLAPTNSGYGNDPRYNGGLPNNQQPANSYPSQNFPANNFPGNTNVPGATTDPFNRDPFASGYGGNPGYPTDPRSAGSGYADPRSNPNPNYGYPTNNTQVPGGTPNWPTDTRVNPGTGAPINYGSGTNNWPTAPANPQPAPGTANQGSFANSEIPKPFLDDNGLRRASFHSGADGENGKTSASAEDVKPWFPFTMALLMLFVSLGGNAYLGWITLTLRTKYLALLERLRRRMTI